jgi:hypothetical protein
MSIYQIAPMVHRPSGSITLHQTETVLPKARRDTITGQARCLRMLMMVPDEFPKAEGLLGSSIRRVLHQLTWLSQQR